MSTTNSTRVELDFDELMEWQMASRLDEFVFPFSLIRFLVKEGFLINPDPELNAINVYTMDRGRKIVFEKTKGFEKVPADDSN